MYRTEIDFFDLPNEIRGLYRYLNKEYNNKYRLVYFHNKDIKLHECSATELQFSKFPILMIYKQQVLDSKVSQFFNRNKILHNWYFSIFLIIYNSEIKKYIFYLNLDPRLTNDIIVIIDKLHAWSDRFLIGDFFQLSYKVVDIELKNKKIDKTQKNTIYYYEFNPNLLIGIDRYEPDHVKTIKIIADKYFGKAESFGKKMFTFSISALQFQFEIFNDDDDIDFLNTLEEYLDEY